MYSITLQNAGGDNVITSGDILGRINFAVPSESDGSAATYIASYITCQAEGSFTSASNPASIVLATSASDSSPAIGRLKVDHSGNFVPMSASSYNLGSSTYPFANVYSDAFIKSGGTSSQFLKADGSVDGSTYAKSVGVANYAAWFTGPGGDDITYYGSDTKDNIYVSTHMYFQSKNGMRFLTDAPAFFGSAIERLKFDSSAGEAVFNDEAKNYDFRVEGQTDSDLLLVDANLDIVQIGKLNINGAFTFPTVDGSAGQSLVTDGAGTVSWSGVSGGGGTDTNDYVDSISFNTSDGYLTLGRTGSLSDLTVDLDGRYLEAHPSTSPASSSDNSGRTYIQDILLDSYGHVTGIATATETVTDTDTTYTDGSGLSLVGTTFHANVDSATQSVAPNSVSSTASRTYAVQVDSNDKLVVNVPWVDTDTNISLSGNLVGDLNLNNYDIVGPGNITIDGNITANSGTLDVLSFNVDNQSILTKGQISWDDTEGVISMGLTDTLTTHIGEQRFYRVRNKTGSPLYKGQVVYATGVHSNGLITPAKYIADNSIAEVRFIGVVLETVNNNNNGYVADFGHIHEIDLRGNVASNYAVGDETWLAGDILYAHPTVSGKLTKVKPKHNITVAIILDNSSNGKMFVRPTTFGDLDDNHTVNTSGVTNGQFLQYNSVTDYWVPSSSGNFTTLQVNGTLVPTGVGTSNYVTKWTGTNDIGNSVVYDNGTNVGIGTASPSAKLHVLDSTGGIKTEGDFIRLVSDSSNVSTVPEITVQGKFNGTSADTLKMQSWGSFGAIRLDSGSPLALQHISGNVGVGTSSPTAKLQVEGGDVAFNQNNGSYTFKVGSTASDNLLYVDGTSNDKVGVGTATLNGKFNVYHSTTNNSFQYGMYNSANHYTTSNGTNYVFGNYTDIRKHVASGVTDTGYVLGHECNALLSDEGSLSSSFGLRTYAGINNQSDNGTLTAAYGIQSRVINYGQGTANINTARGVDVYIQGDLSSPGNGKITNAYGVYVQTPLNVTTYAYGLYIAAMDSGTTNKYGIYQNGANDTNVLMGNVGIGTNDPSSPLTVAASNEEGIRIHTASAPSQNFIIGRNTSNGTLVFKGSQSDFSAYEFRSTIGGSSQTVLQTDRLSGAITFNDEYTFPTTDGSADQVLVTNGSGSVSWQDQNVDISSVNGRLTLETATPISTTNQTAKTTLYFTPYQGNQIALYDGTSWSIKTLAEISLSLSGYAADTNFDIFVYDNSGTLTLESVAWTNDTTRATELTTQDGVYVKSGATTRRYLGTIRTTATTGQCEDSTIRRFVWNYYNREIRIMSGYLDEGGGSHTYSGGSWRAYNNSTSVTTSNGGTRVELVIGINSPIHFHVNAQNKYGFTGISYDTTTSITTNAVIHDGTNTGSGMRSTASDIYNLSAGFHYLQVVENSVSTNTATFYWLQHRSYLRG